MDPHLLIMRKSLIQKRAGERSLYVCVCVSIFVSAGGWLACTCVSGVQMKRWIPGNRDGVRGKGWHSTTPLARCVHPAHLSAFSRPPLPPLIRMELIWLYISLYGWLVCVDVCVCVFSATAPRRNRCAHFIILSTRALDTFGVFSHWIRVQLLLSFHSLCLEETHSSWTRWPFSHGLLNLLGSLSVRPTSVTHPVLSSFPPLSLALSPAQPFLSPQKPRAFFPSTSKISAKKHTALRLPACPSLSRMT